MKKVKQEFEASEEEEEEPLVSSYNYRKSTIGDATLNIKQRGGRKPEKIAIDDDNFPKL